MAGDMNSEPAIPDLLSGLRLDELLREVQDRLAEIMATRDRMQGLLDAFLAVATGLELDTTLRRIVRPPSTWFRPGTGRSVCSARTAASPGSSTWASTRQTRAEMGHLPEGKGLLGQLITDPRPLRLADLSTHEASVGFPAEPPADAQLPRRAGAGAATRCSATCT